MEIQPAPRTSTAPPPGTGERGFDKLQNPLGMTIIALSLLIFAMICYWGSRWVRSVSKNDMALRQDLRAQLLASDAARDSNDVR